MVDGCKLASDGNQRRQREHHRVEGHGRHCAWDFLMRGVR
jgi:hypothetical protein